MRATPIIAILVLALGCLKVPSKPGGDAGTDSSGNDTGPVDWGAEVPDVCVGCQPCSPVGIPGFDMDDDGIVDECDACPFQHNLGGNGQYCDEDFDPSTLVGDWIAVSFSVAAGAGTSTLSVRVQKAQYGNDYQVIRTLDAVVMGTVVTGTRGHIWFKPGYQEVYPVSEAGFQGMISRLGDKVVMTEVLPGGAQGPGFLILLRQSAGVVPLKGGAGAAAVPRPPASGKWVMSGFLSGANEKNSMFLPLFQVATVGTTDGVGLTLDLGGSDELDANTILLLNPDHAMSMSVADVRIEPLYTGGHTFAFDFKGGLDLPVLSLMPKGTHIALGGAVSYFQDFAVFSGGLSPGGNVNATLVVVLARVPVPGTLPSDLPTPLYRLGTLDGNQSQSIRSSIVPAQNRVQAAFDVMDMASGAAEGPRICLDPGCPVAGFAPSANPYGLQILESDCLRSATVVKPRGGEPSGSGVYTYAWLGLASWGSFSASDVGFALISDASQMFPVTNAWSGFAFLVPGRPSADPVSPFDADVDGTPSYLNLTECDPGPIPDGHDGCPCSIGSPGNAGC